MALSIEKDEFPQQFSTDVRILVIDHDIHHLNTIEKMCSQFNYPVKTCSEVSEALDLLMEKKDCFDLVLIEAQMPDMSSYDFLQHVTQQINIPVIMMCVDDAISDVKKAIENGACIYWKKPLSENQIKYMWKYVALKIWNEKRKQEIDETFEGECMKKKEKDEKNKDKHDSPMEKLRVVWTPELHKIFVSAMMELDSDKAVPTKILDKMKVAGLTREHIASHLQKYRHYRKEKEAEKQQQIHNQNQNAILKSSFCPNFSHAIQQQNSMSYGCSSSQQVPNNLMARKFPHQFNNLITWHQLPPESNNTLPPQQEHCVNDVHQTSPASVNHQIPTTQSFPMSSSTIDANIGAINANVTRAEETELDSSLKEDVMKSKEGTILEACESKNKVEGSQNMQGINYVTNDAEMKKSRRSMRSRKATTMLKDYVRE